ncbi:ATP-binding protein [Dyella koreensis]|uniref:histidine kinase n=1 Tax=Dyella koreensis TaxID=311235 RepID=A0ABW8K8C0_9GAMM
MLPFREFVRRLSRTARARILFIGCVLALAAFSGHPFGATMSGALDKVLFDLSSRLFRHHGSRQVAVVLIDGRTLRQYGTDGVTERTRSLLRYLDRAASISLDYPLAPDAHTGALAEAVGANGRVVLPMACDAMEQGAEALPLALHTHAAGSGQRHLLMGHYGVVSGFVPYVHGAAGDCPHIVLEALRVSGMEYASELSDTRLHASATARGMRPEDEAVLVMMGNPARVPRYSMADVLSGRVPSSVFSGRMVFVGDAMGEDAGYHTSALRSEPVARAMLDALMADAVARGNMAREIGGVAAVPIYVAIALGMTLICLLVPGWWMHVAAFTWGGLMFLFPILLLGVTHRWLALGLLPLACLLIYTHFAWERLRRTQNLLRKEIGKLREISAAIGVAGAGKRMPVTSARHDPIEDMRQAMREIRNWQGTFVNMLNQLPYPVFVVTGGRSSVWNARAADMLRVSEQAESGNAVTLSEVQRLVVEHCHDREGASVEVVVGGEERLLLYVPYTVDDATLHPDATDEHASFLVCLIDIAAIKKGVANDKKALRHIAHDLRSPLSTILSLIEDRVEGQRRAGPQDRAFLEDLRRQADYSLRVAKDFLQLSRAEQIHHDMFRPVDLLDLATEAVDQLWPRAMGKSIELMGPECELETTLTMANADMLIRAIVNVIDNALKYSPPGTRVTVRIAYAGPDLLGLCVADQGIGIAEDDLVHLFDPFFQVATRHEENMGVGLGLPFVKAVIERHSGSITVTSQPGRGTEVRMVLPRAIGI